MARANCIQCVHPEMRSCIQTANMHACSCSVLLMFNMQQHMLHVTDVDEYLYSWSYLDDTVNITALRSFRCHRSVLGIHITLLSLLHF